MAVLWKLGSSRDTVDGIACLLVTLLTLLAARGASGQQPDTTATDSAAAPEVYTTDDLAAFGSFDFLDTMRRLVPSIWVPQEQIADLTSGMRPFQLRGLSPDYTLVRINGVRRHSMAAVHTTGHSMPGSSGVDLNAIPRLALERVELHEGGSTARYGSGAVAGVLDLRLRSGARPLTVEAHTGKHFPDWFDDDGWRGRVAANGGFEVPGLGGTLNLTGEYLHRTSTSRAGASDRQQIEEGDGDRLEQLDDDPLLDVAEKRNPVPQPTFQIADGFYENRMVWGIYERPAGEEREAYLWGGRSDRTDHNFAFFRRALEPRSDRRIYPLGFLPTFDVDTRDVQMTGGVRGRWDGWRYDFSGSFGRNRIDAGITNTLNGTLGPCLSIPCAPGEDGEPGTSDDPGIPNQRSFYLGSLESGQALVSLDVERRFRATPLGPLTLSLGAGARTESYRIEEGEPASYVDGGGTNQYGGVSQWGAQGYFGWRPQDARADRRASAAVHATAESRPAAELRATVAARLAAYQGIGTLGGADLALAYRLHPVLAVNLSAGINYRVPGLAISNWTHADPSFTGTWTRFMAGEFAVDSPAARALGARPLYEEWVRHAAGGVELGPLAGLELSVRSHFTRIFDGVALSDPFRGADVLRVLAEADPEIGEMRFAANVLGLDAYGADVRATYRPPLGGGHDLEVTARLHLNRVEVRDVDPPAGLVPDVFGSFLSSETIDRIEHGRPEEVGLASADYRWRGLHLSLRGRYYGASACAARCVYGRDERGDPTDTLATWPAKTTLDAEFGYDFENGVEVSLGGQNLTDVMPEPTPSLVRGDSPGSFDNIFWPGSPYPWVNGRYLYVSTRWTLD